MVYKSRIISGVSQLEPFVVTNCIVEQSFVSLLESFLGLGCQERVLCVSLIGAIVFLRNTSPTFSSLPGSLLFVLTILTIERLWLSLLLPLVAFHWLWFDG
jgi:hypothetical protein